MLAIKLLQEYRAKQKISEKSTSKSKKGSKK